MLKGQESPNKVLETEFTLCLYLLFIYNVVLGLLLLGLGKYSFMKAQLLLIMICIWSYM